MAPLVSIIMNCYNGEKYLDQCIKSVLDQTYDNWEIIFWDNQSKDNSKKICLSFNDKRIKYFYAQFHTDLYEARNLAIDKTNGELIAFLDTDDLWYKEKLSIQVAFFRENKIGLVCSNFIFLNEMNNKKKIWHNKKNKSGYVLDNLLKEYFIGLPTVMIRKKALHNLKYIFNSKYNIIGDFDLFIRISQEWQIKYLDEPLALYRWHGKNIAFNETDREIIELENWLESMKTEKKIISNKNLIYVKHKLNYLISKEFLRNKNYKMTIISLLKIKNPSLTFRLFIQLIIPNFLLNFILKFKFR